MKEKIKKKKLSLGIAILAIFLIIYGANELSSYLRFPKEEGVVILAWAIVYLTSGIGLFAKKFWAYRLTQATFIICMVTTPLVLFLGDTSFMIKLTLVLIFELIFGFILYYLSKRRIKEQFLGIVEEEEPSGKKSVQETLHTIFATLGYILYFIFGIWSFLVNLSIANEILGFWGVLLGFTLFPVLLVVMPWYALVAWGNWFPLAVTYGGLILAFALNFIASLFSEDGY